MKIFFNKRADLKEIEVTVEAGEKTVMVERILSDLASLDQTLGNYIVQIDGEIHQLPIADIKWIEVFGDYITLHLVQQEITLRKTLNQIEKELPQQKFVRASRNTLINLEEIIKIENGLSGNMTAILTSGVAIHISRKYWKNIKQRILNHE